MTLSYDIILSALGIERMMNFEDEAANVSGYGADNKPFFWIVGFKEAKKIEDVPGFHFAFNAVSKEAVRNWYAQALRHGARDNGEPGYRLEYYPGYYAAFVIDPDGWRLEAVFHDLSKVQ